MRRLSRRQQAHSLLRSLLRSAPRSPPPSPPRSPSPRVPTTPPPTHRSSRSRISSTVISRAISMAHRSSADCSACSTRPVRSRRSRASTSFIWPWDSSSGTSRRARPRLATRRCCSCLSPSSVREPERSFGSRQPTTSRRSTSRFARSSRVHSGSPCPTSRPAEDRQVQGEMRNPEPKAMTRFVPPHTPRRSQRRSPVSLVGACTPTRSISASSPSPGF